MTATQLVTPEELYQMGSNAPYELWEGVLNEESPSSSKPSAIAVRLSTAIFNVVDAQQSGFVTNPNGGYILSSDPTTVVAPDVGFFWGARYPGGMPDQAPEVVERTGTLDGGAVLPGFELELRSIFRD